MSSISAQQPITPILGIPDDIFRSMMEIIAQLDRPYPPTSKDALVRANKDSEAYPPWALAVHGGSLGWIRMTHVCRDWRNRICETMPLLWAQDIGCLPDGCKEMLRRAGDSAMLDVRLGYNKSITSFRIPLERVLVNSLFHSSGRIRTLRYIDVRRAASVTPISLSLRSRQLSSLEAVDVHFLDIDSVNMNRGRTSIVLPEGCIIQSDRLRAARFTNYFIPWTSRSLTVLCIAFCVADGGLSPATLHDTLSQVEDTIEELELDMAISIELVDSGPIEHTFPRLRCLHIRELSGILVAFFPHIHYPDTAKVNLTIDGGRSSTWDDQVRSLALDVLGRLQWGPIRTQTITIVDASQHPLDAQNGLQVRVSRHDGSTSPVRPLDDYCLGITVEHRIVRPARRDRVLTLLLHTLGGSTGSPWENVTDLDLDMSLRDWHIGEIDVVVHYIRSLSQLRRLRLVDPVGGSSTDGRSHLLPARLLIPLSHKPLNRLHILQHCDQTFAHSFFALCHALTSILANGVGAGPKLSPAFDHLLLEIIEGTPEMVPHGVERHVRPMFAKYSNSFELNIKRTSPS
ncbi:unnamed protein product [Peniophora sp. CBMAI 1063]|nr:unnamed protein product [Peniophora sp. CBMAI 1063]